MVVKVPTYEEDNYRLRVEEYEKRLTPKTKMVLLSSPNNPTGCVLAPSSLDAVANVARAHGIYVVCDDVYNRLVYEPAMSALPPTWTRSFASRWWWSRASPSPGR